MILLPPPGATRPESPSLVGRQAATFTLTPAPSKSNDVPLWAFIVMTTFALCLMVFVGVLLWKPLIFHPQRLLELQQERRREKLDRPAKSSSRWPKLRGLGGSAEATPAAAAAAAPRKIEVQPPADDGSGRPPWFRGGSLRRDIDRWRRAVDGTPGEEPTIAGGGEPPRYMNYAPAQRGPASTLGRISEYGYYGDVKSSTASPTPSRPAEPVRISILPPPMSPLTEPVLSRPTPPTMITVSAMDEPRSRAAPPTMITVSAMEEAVAAAEYETEWARSPSPLPFGQFGRR